MKKVMLAIMLASGLMAASEGLYMGLEYGKASNSQTFILTDSYDSISADIDNDYSDVKIKIGNGADGGWKMQGTFSIIDYDQGIYDYDNNALYEIGFDFIKEFEVAPSVYPFLKVGFGGGQMETSMTIDDVMYRYNLNAGIGLSYKASEHFYLLIGADYIWGKWSDVDLGYGLTLETKDRAFKPYVGVNYQF